LAYEECAGCHDPHAGDNWQFAKDSLAGEFGGANLCAFCHIGKMGGDDHRVDVLATAPQLPMDRVWNPDASPADFSGTRLFDAAGDAEVPSGDAFIKCATCHVSHGGVPDTDLNSMAYSESDSTRSPICDNCHP
jgi:predicted CXXCH cytochrome family protein